MLVSAPGIFIAEGVGEGSDRTTCSIPLAQAPWLYHSHIAMAFHIADRILTAVCLFKLLCMGQRSGWEKPLCHTNTGVIMA